MLASVATWSPGGPYRIFAIRGFAVSFHLLHNEERREVVLIDTGLSGELGVLRRVLKNLGFAWPDIRAILLTHGHLDHTRNLARIKELSGALVYAHPADQAHIDGRFPYEGVNRWCGRLEAIGRVLFGYRSIPIDQPLTDGMQLPFWGGLQVVHLPGHTDGHCGFYSERFRLLFSGDIFASYGFSTHLPPPILNSRPKELILSLRRVERLNPDYLIPNHYDGLDGKLHRRKFDALLRRLSDSPKYSQS